MRFNTHDKLIKAHKLRNMLSRIPADTWVSAQTLASTGNLSICKMIGLDEFETIGHIDLAEEKIYWHASNPG